VDLSLEGLEDLTQLKRDEIDHVVLGIDVTNDVPPPMTLVVRTRRPYDEPKVRAAHPDQWTPAPSDKPLHGIEMKVGRIKLLAALWCADARTIVVFVNVKGGTIKRVPAVPQSGSGRLSAPLRDFLRQRMGEGVPAWVVGDPESWDKTALWHPDNWENLNDLLSVVGPNQRNPLARLPVQALTKEERQLARKVRTFGAWLRLDQHIEWLAAFDCGTQATAQTLRERLLRRLEEAKAAAAVELNDSWVTIVGRTSLEGLREALAGTKAR
jgi:hypothetical protein